MNLVASDSPRNNSGIPAPNAPKMSRSLARLIQPSALPSPPKCDAVRSGNKVVE